MRQAFCPHAVLSTTFVLTSTCPFTRVVCRSTCRHSHDLVLACQVYPSPGLVAVRFFLSAQGPATAAASAAEMSNEISPRGFHQYLTWSLFPSRHLIQHCPLPGRLAKFWKKSPGDEEKEPCGKSGLGFATIFFWYTRYDCPKKNCSPIVIILCNYSTLFHVWILCAQTQHAHYEL